MVAVVVAGDDLLAAGVVFVVLSGQLHAAFVELHLDQSAGLVTEHQHALQGAGQREAVHRGAEGVVLGDDGVVVGVVAFNQAEMHGHVGGADGGAVLSVADLDGIVAGGKHAAQDVGDLLGQDEVALHAGLHALVQVLHQLASVGGGEDDVVVVDIEVDAVHDHTDFVVGCGEERAAESVGNHAGRQAEAGAFVAECTGCGVGIGALSGDVEGAGGVLALNPVALLVHAEFDGLLGYLADGVHHLLGRDAESAGAFLLEHGDGGDEAFFGIAGRDDHASVFRFNEEAVQDGEGVFRGQCLAGHTQSAHESHA